MFDYLLNARHCSRCCECEIIKQDFLLWRFTYKEKERYEHCKVQPSGEKEDMEKNINDSLLGLFKNSNRSCNKIWRNNQLLSWSCLYLTGYVLLSGSPITGWFTLKREIWDDIAALSSFHVTSLVLELFSILPCLADCPNYAWVNPTHWVLGLFSSSTHLGQVSATGLVSLGSCPVRW